MFAETIFIHPSHIYEAFCSDIGLHSDKSRDCKAVQFLYIVSIFTTFPTELNVGNEVKDLHSLNIHDRFVNVEIGNDGPFTRLVHISNIAIPFVNNGADIPVKSTFLSDEHSLNKR